MNHANAPIGPVGHPTELQLMLNTYAYSYTKYPNAVREYLRFMWEREQVDAWLRAANGYVSPPLPAWNDNPVWTEDPKVTPFRDGLKFALDNGYSGSLGKASAAVMEISWSSTCSARRAPETRRQRRPRSAPPNAPSATTRPETAIRHASGLGANMT